MKKQIFVALALTIVFSSLIQVAFAQTPITNTTVAVSYITNLNTQIRLVNERYLKANQSAKSSLVITLRTLLEDRKREMLGLAKINPRLFLFLVMTAADRTKLPLDLQAKVERPAQVEGKVEVWHSDTPLANTTGKFIGFDPDKSRYDYSLRQGQTKFSLYPTKFLGLRSETTLRVSGYQLESSLVSNTDISANVVVTADAPAIAATGDQRTLVLLVNFLDSSNNEMPFTPQEVNDYVFNSKFQDFYREQSYGKVSFSGDVKGWYTVLRNEAPRNGLGDYDCTNRFRDDLQYSEVTNLIVTKGINLADYDRVVVFKYYNHCAFSSHSTIGSGVYVDGQIYNISIAIITAHAPLTDPQFYNDYYWRALAHEMGHSLGLVHANGLDCGDQVYAENCVPVEYGNVFDGMGQGLGKHFNAVYKYTLGWIDPVSVLTITQSGRYTINPLELGSGAKLAKILLPGGTTPYYFEYRRAYGYDSNLNSANQYGLMAEVILPGGPTNNPIAGLVDFAPTADPFAGDVADKAVLSVGQVFYDRIRGIAIGPIVSANDNGITFDVDMHPVIPCAHSPSTIEQLTTNPRVMGGGSGTLAFKINDNDRVECGPVNLIVRKLPLADQLTNVNYSPQSFQLSPGQSVVVNESFTAPNVATSRYIHNQSGLEIFDQENNLTTDKAVSIYVGAPSIIISISPTSIAPGSIIYIAGSRLIDPDFPSRIEFVRNDTDQITSVKALSSIGGLTGIAIYLVSPLSLSSGEYSVRVCRADVCSNSKAVTVFPGVATIRDTTPPSVPTNLTATIVSNSQINLQWLAATDPIVSGQSMSGLMGYKIYRNNTHIATIGASTTYQNVGLVANTTYQYSVVAYDLAFNNSAKSLPVSTIISPAVKVTSPNGGELILRGSRLPYRITWQELNFDNPSQYKIKLDLKSDRGDRTLFTNLIGGVGYKDWFVPKDLPLGKYKLSVCVVKDSNPCAYSDQSDNYFSIIDTATPEPITPIIPSPVEPTPIPPPATTTAAIISPIIVTPSPTPVPTLTASAPPNNAVDARAGNGLSFKLAALTFSSDLGSDWNNLANWSVVSTQPQTTATAPPSVASIAGSPYRPIVILSRNIIPGERVTIAHKPTGAKVCLGFLPGDVDQNGWALSSDIGLLNSWVGTAEGASQLFYKTDINRDGVFDAKDVTRAGELLSSTTTPALRSLPACPAPLTSISSQSQLANALAALRALINRLGQLLIMSR